MFANAFNLDQSQILLLCRLQLRSMLANLKFCLVKRQELTNQNSR